MRYLDSLSCIFLGFFFFFFFPLIGIVEMICLSLIILQVINSCAKICEFLFYFWVYVHYDWMLFCITQKGKGEKKAGNSFFFFF